MWSIDEGCRRSRKNLLIKNQFLTHQPLYLAHLRLIANLIKNYKKGADDETFVTFYFTEAAATPNSFAEAPKNVPLL
jgi:hypothetical protein